MPTLADWPGGLHRQPPRSSPTYWLRAPLARWLELEAGRAARDLGRYRVLDVGCGSKPYYPYFEPHASEYVGVDLDNPSADLQGPVEEIPVEDGSFDVVICTQVLEHAADPDRAVRELRRVTAPGGRVLASTHGVMAYHPAPVDYWRWTHAGLERLFERSGEWASVRVRPASGTASSVATILALYVNHAFRRAGAAPVGGAVVRMLNGLGGMADRRSALLREPVPGSLFVNYHVTAEVGPA